MAAILSRESWVNHCLYAITSIDGEVGSILSEYKDARTFHVIRENL